MPSPLLVKNTNKGERASVPLMRGYQFFFHQNSRNAVKLFHLMLWFIPAHKPAFAQQKIDGLVHIFIHALFCFKKGNVPDDLKL